MRRHLVVITVVLLAGLTLPALSQAVTASGSSGARVDAARTTASVKLTSTESALLKLINKERAKKGLHSVAAVDSLMKAARGHSADMAKHKYFSHNSYNGERFDARLVRYGYTRSGFSSWQAGEDLYCGNGAQASPAAVVRAWMKSPAHRAVILCKSMRDIGLGSSVCTSGYLGLPNVTFFTLDMGRRIR